ncbi:constitutive coactivator of peroxisome proliferator-activated receptor gamma-like [Patiria miniata]|uniref:Constitutive coactivator of peroxisome proliferator-activated receptor gamma n=1 Tax=Patiria miniata TaxID=46514 RepID=A0A913ZZR1_PATMI|nr:constitutive coactivator of peroxisome proliferator-activated receptor gamma-like [Patiria miniata]XP_038056557.1 constitutive coactivator of peroxisome proliferator-activated receptor gamma-like [Patiria miniata]XP_038056558.1 constitutive coactivator of peroxisome proliferator-activated receptor gamma-like [Patiria miniata]XP_038056559.1 constitutive coactivator of peroxisome proliferator-activated receptor gamma-like [Patiria miniata]
MGVKGLQVFADTNCPGALVRVNIAKLAADFHRRFDRKPVLVVDGMGCLRIFYNPKTPWVYGGQWKEFLNRLKRFVDAFTSAGIELVFIFDGVVETSKVAEWVRRRNDEMKTVAKIYRSIKEDGRHPQTNLLHLPPSMSFYSQQALKMCGATVYCSFIEADRAIFHYYKKYQCFGVLGQDSDFLVFDIHNYFSLNSLYFERGLGIKRYDKERLCRQLRLQPFHLPLLACLMGNDVIAHAKLGSFHQSITGTTPNKMADLLPAVARFLSDLQIQILTPEVVEDLEQRVFGRAQHMWGLMDKVVRQYIMTEPEPHKVVDVTSTGRQQHQKQGLPQTSLQSKSGSNVASEDRPTSQDGSASSQQVFQAIRRAHLNAEIPARIDNLFSHHLYQRGPAIEDCTDSTMPSAGPLFEPIRKKLYGLLLGGGLQEDVSVPQASAPATSSSFPDTIDKNPASSSPVTSRLVVGVNAVREWVAQPGRTLAVEPEITEAEPLDMPGGTPRLEALWLGPQAEVRSLKFETFLACMHCDLDPAQLQRIPAHFRLLCVVLQYFEKHTAPRFLRETDVDAFLAQAVCLTTHYMASVMKLRVDRVDPRGVHLASLFMRGVSLVCSVNAACGRPLDMADLMPWRFFDGELFHAKYLMSQDGASVEQLCDRNVAAVEDFRLLKTCIYSRTPATGYQQHAHSDS